MLDLKITLEQQLRLQILEDKIPNMTTKEITDKLIEMFKAIMLASNRFKKSNELTLSQQFELYRMQNIKIGREDAISLLLEAIRQLMIKENVLAQLDKSHGSTK